MQADTLITEQEGEPCESELKAPYCSPQLECCRGSVALGSVSPRGHSQSLAMREGECGVWNFKHALTHF